VPDNACGGIDHCSDANYSPDATHRCTLSCNCDTSTVRLRCNMYC
jgi:hypothetical protein